MVIESARSFFSDLLPEDPEVDTVNMTPDEVRKSERNRRFKVYRLICFSGVALMLWGDKSVLDKLNHFNNISPYVWSLYFTVALVCMLLGAIAASFPDSSPCAMAVSSNGVVQTFVYMIVSFHLKIMEFYAKEEYMLASMALSSAFFIIFWCFCSRDLQESSKVSIKKC
ncbi:hypothetical protein ACP4OV_014683 [Aristida adscensionis]